MRPKRVSLLGIMLLALAACTERSQNNHDHEYPA